MKIPAILALVLLAANTVQAEPITIVAYNAENLFDTVDDPDNPRDDTYLPLSVKDQDRPTHDRRCEQYNGTSGFYVNQCKPLDWSAQVYGTKLQRYADVLAAMPSLPHVVVIPETENKAVLDDLVTRHFPTAGYEVVQLDSSDKPDSRGIDVGLITRLKLAGTPKAHPIDFEGDAEKCGKTRDILQVPVRLPRGETLHVFGVHFPSGGSPFECRIRAFKTLSGLAAALPANSLSVAAGDFTINCLEGPSDAFDRLLQRGNWYASPLVTSGCNAPGSSKHVDNLLDRWNTWSFLDMILVSRELSPTQPSTQNWFADLGSFGTMSFIPSRLVSTVMTRVSSSRGVSTR